MQKPRENCRRLFANRSRDLAASRVIHRLAPTDRSEILRANARCETLIVRSVELWGADHEQVSRWI
jgi:hypothetical protein